MKLPIIVLLLCATLSTQTIGKEEVLIEKLEKGITTTNAINKAGELSQRKIDSVERQTQQLIDDYRQSNENLKQLQTNNQHLQQVLNQQKERLETLSKQLDSVAITEKAIVPMMIDMVDALESFIKQDTPFLREERLGRIEQLQQMMISHEVDLPEKYRRILDTYEIEREFGYTIETYPEELALVEQRKRVNILRIGRVGLYYQTPDGLQQGYWDSAQASWQPLPGEYGSAIKQGLSLAREESAPTLLRLPFVPTTSAGGEQ